MPVLPWYGQQLLLAFVAMKPAHTRTHVAQLLDRIPQRAAAHQYSFSCCIRHVSRTAMSGSARRTPQQQQQQRQSPARTPSTYHTPATGNGYTPSTPLEGWYSIMSALSATPAASRTGERQVQALLRGANILQIATPVYAYNDPVCYSLSCLGVACMQPLSPLCSVSLTQPHWTPMRPARPLANPRRLPIQAPLTCQPQQPQQHPPRAAPVRTPLAHQPSSNTHQHTATHQRQPQRRGWLVLARPRQHTQQPGAKQHGAQGRCS